MAKTKADYIQEAEALGLKVSAKNTIAEIQAALKESQEKAAVAPIHDSKLMTHDSTSPKPLAKSGVARSKPLAKSGKRSAKAQQEADAKVEKEAKKASGEAADAADTEPKKPVQTPARPRIERRGKKYREVAKLIDKTKLYSLSEACQLAVKTSTSTFDASAELHIRLGVDPRQADQNVRATVALPHGTGKTIRVAVYAPSDQHGAAQKAGADIVGEEDFLKLLDKEQYDFDVLIATPTLMSKLSKYARALGPKGLMPNPKSGTVAADVGKAVLDAKSGRVEYRVDEQGIVHTAFGKVSFGAEKLAANAEALLASIKTAKPTSLKGNYVVAISMTTTMGPSIKLELV